MTDVQDAATGALDIRVLYRILALRSAVFVVEQESLYLDLDGRDLEPGARQLWIADGDEVAATLRVLDDTGTARIGRVATARGARGRGLAAALVRRALELAGDREVVLDAQTYLQRWYEGFGFARTGPDYVEDGIAHLPMRLERP